MSGMNVLESIGLLAIIFVFSLGVADILLWVCRLGRHEYAKKP